MSHWDRYRARAAHSYRNLALSPLGASRIGRHDDSLCKVGNALLDVLENGRLGVQIVDRYVEEALYLTVTRSVTLPFHETHLSWFLATNSMVVLYLFQTQTLYSRQEPTPTVPRT